MRGKDILIIGGTGTLGRGLTSSLIQSNSNQKIVIFSRDEVKQLEMMNAFPKSKFPNLKFMIGDVRDKERVSEACRGIDLVINAAAIKHVVIAELNPKECYKTNVDGARNVIDSCLKNDVENCILISTDKALRPQGVYGRSKKTSEELMAQANTITKNKFATVRFGNIIGSRASVSEIFKKMAHTGKLTITDVDATRFGIKLSDAVDFLISISIKMKGGEIFTPEMKAFKIIDLARAIAPKSTFKIIGLRPGDKLHEVVEDASGKLIYSNETEIMDEQDIRLALKM